MSLPSSLSSQKIDAIGPVIKQHYSLCKISVYAVHHPIKHHTKPLTFVCITFFVARLSVTVKWLFKRVHFFIWTNSNYSDWWSTSVPPVYSLTISRYNLLYILSSHDSQSSFFPCNIISFSMDFLSTSSACTFEPKAVITVHSMKGKYCSTLTYRWSGQLHAMTILPSEEH